MLELLQPFERFFHSLMGYSALNKLFFHIFRAVHLYLYEYADYLVFGMLAVLPYYLIPKSWRPNYLLLASVTMIGAMFGADFAFYLVAVPLLVHGVLERFVPRAQRDPVFRVRAISGLVVAVLVLYGLLLMRETFEWSFRIPWIDRDLDVPLLHWCGIAFMLPKLIHFIVDRLTGKIGAARRRDFLLFLLFFPILRLGPIERFQNFERDLKKCTVERVGRFDIVYGLYRIALGAAKTALYAAYLYPWRMEATPLINDIGWLRMYAMICCGMIEVYFHFGGYSDIAIGFSRLFGFKAMENFYLPFFSRNIGEWWRRWHISLSFWLRDYVYRPLGGNKRHALVNALITFTLCGAWHYLSWNYVVWGLLQGVGLAGLAAWQRFWRQVANNQNQRGFLHSLYAYFHARPRLSYGLGVVTTLHYFWLSGAFFILEMDEALLLLARLASFGFYHAP